MKPINIENAKQLLQEKIKNKNLQRHCYAVGLVMKAYYDYYLKEGRDMQGLTSEDWEITGLLHDSDYEVTNDDWNQHTLVLLDWLKEYEVKEEILNALRSHNNKITGLKEPETLLEWTLECCDELTGFIVAVALIKPSKKLSDVTTEGVLKRFKQKEFARAVDRTQITQCEERVGVPVEKFVEISLKAMQKNAALLEM